MAAVLLLAQDAGRAQFAAGVNLVRVYASVTDGRGNPVQGLAAADFTVLEDGRPQTVSTFVEGEFPLSVAIAVDHSFSMAGAELGAARTGALTFLSALRPRDEAMIVGIGSEVEQLAPLSADRTSQQRVVASLAPWGTTGLYDSVIASIDMIQAASGRRALLLLSDGNDRYSRATASQALARARESDVMVYPVALGRSRPPLFAELADLTGGRSFQPRDVGQLTAAMRAIADELRHQYLLGYTPSRPIVAAQAEWRSITVRVNRPDLVVRARDGYTTAAARR